MGWRGAHFAAAALGLGTNPTSSAATLAAELCSRLNPFHESVTTPPCSASTSSTSRHTPKRGEKGNATTGG